MDPRRGFLDARGSCHLEQLAGELACERASDEEINALIALHLKMVDYYKANDRMPYYKLNQEFHSRLSALSKNAILAEMQRIIQARLKRIRYIGNDNPVAWAGAVEDHEAMIHALKLKNGKQLGDAMIKHIKNTWDRVKDSL